METKYSLTYSEQPTTGSYPEPAGSITHFCIDVHFNIILSSAQRLSVHISFSGISLASALSGNFASNS